MTSPRRTIGSKADLRQQLRARRAAVAPAARRKAALAAAIHLARALRARHASRVAIYIGSGAELSTAPLLERLARCRVYVPKVGGEGAMRFVRLRPGLPLRRNRYRIREPVAGERAARLDAIVAPLLAFDARGHRLGQGGGYYDRILGRGRAIGRPLRIGYAYAAQEIPRVPDESHDARLDAVVTERGFRRFRGERM
jgi:5-formyltetrahydrofolate cyclo-ligase